MWENHCYILYDKKTRHAILIDPAWEKETITQVILSHHLIPRAILITHGHLDHVNLAQFFSAQYNIPVICHADEASHYNIQLPNLFCFKRESTLEFGSLKIRTIFTPGHTIAGVCYMAGENLFTGDTLFMETCGVCVDTGSSHEKLYDSLQKIKQEPASTKIYPGHRYQHNLGQDLAACFEINLYLQIENLEDFLKIRHQQSKFLKVPKAV